MDKRTSGQRSESKSPVTNTALFIITADMKYRLKVASRKEMGAEDKYENKLQMD